VAVFANRIAALEGGVVACATASGTSAVLITMLSLTSKGDNFVSASTVHGGTYHTYKKLAPQLGLEGRFVSTNNAEDFAIQIDSKTKFLFVESISNPKYDVPDFAMLARIAHDNGIPLVVSFV
jgi:O-acetylhomoserine/O-acetylserine sulfhydrylase